MNTINTSNHHNPPREVRYGILLFLKKKKKKKKKKLFSFVVIFQAKKHHIPKIDSEHQNSNQEAAHHIPQEKTRATMSASRRLTSFTQPLLRRFTSNNGGCKIMNSSCNIKDHAITILKQKVFILKLISDEDYIKPAHSSSSSLVAPQSCSVGAHIRHSLDHFGYVCDAIHGNSTLLQYDDRSRETNIERMRYKAVERCESYAETIHQADLERIVDVSFMGNDKGGKYVLPSNVGREISFVAHHGIHHLASIRVIMEHMGYVVTGMLQYLSFVLLPIDYCPLSDIFLPCVQSVFITHPLLFLSLLDMHYFLYLSHPLQTIISGLLIQPYTIRTIFHLHELENIHNNNFCDSSNTSIGQLIGKTVLIIGPEKKVLLQVLLFLTMRS